MPCQSAGALGLSCKSQRQPSSSASVVVPLAFSQMLIASCKISNASRIVMPARSETCLKASFVIFKFDILPCLQSGGTTACITGGATYQNACH